MRPPSAKQSPIFTYGCCIPTYESFWLFIFLFLVVLVIISCFLGVGIGVRWMYKRRIRKQLATIEKKHKKKIGDREQKNFKLAEMAAKPNNRKEFERQSRIVKKLQTEFATLSMENSKSLSEMSQASSWMTSLMSARSDSRQMGLAPVPLDPTISNREVDVFTNECTVPPNTNINNNINNNTNIVSTTNSTTAPSVVTVINGKEEQAPAAFPIEDSVLAGTVNLMAGYCSATQLGQQKIRNAPPVSYSKNGRRMHSTDDLSAFKEGPVSSSAPNSSRNGSAETMDQSDKPSSETSVSPSTLPTMSPRKNKNKKLLSEKSIDGFGGIKNGRNLARINEEERDYRTIVSDKELGPTFPYYTESVRAKEVRKNSLINKSNLEVRKADEGLVKSTGIGQKARSSPTSNSTVSSWVPNVYDLRREADRQRAEMETENARILLEERKKQRMNTGEYSSNGLFSSAVRPAPSASEMLQKNGEQVYQTRRGDFISPYDIRINMDDSNSQRGFVK